MINNNRGIALISVILISVVIFLLVGVLTVSNLGTHSRVNQERKINILRNVAEMGVAHLQQGITDFYMETQDLTLTPGYEDTNFEEDVTIKGRRYNFTAQAVKSALSTEVHAIFNAVSTATDLETGEFTRVNFVLDLQGDVITRFFIFSIRDLELHPGPNMSISGDLHAKGGIFINPTATLEIGSANDDTKAFHTEREFLWRDKFNFYYYNDSELAGTEVGVRTGTCRIKGELFQKKHDSTDPSQYAGFSPFQRPASDPGFDFDIYAQTHWRGNQPRQVVQRHATPVAVPAFHSVQRNGFYHQKALESGIAIIDNQVWINGVLQSGNIPAPPIGSAYPVEFEEASTGAASGHPGTHACDNNLNTYYYANTTIGSAQSITFDLREERSVAKISIAFYSPSNRTYTYKVDVSNNKTAWTNVVPSRDSSKATWQEHTISPADYRYIRITCTKVNTSSSSNRRLGVCEIKVYSAPPPWTPPPSDLDWVYFMPNPEDNSADSFKDYRENIFVRALTIDIGKLNKYIQNHGIVFPSHDHIDNTPGFLIYASYRLPEGESGLPALYLKNGSVLIDNMTVATENPLYISGNFNCNTANGNAKYYDACVIAECTTLLSAGFNTKSTMQGNNETASQTHLWVNTILVGGNMDTYYIKTDGTVVTTEEALSMEERKQIKANILETRVYHNGGMHNFVRFLENWNNKTVHIRGALVDMFDTITVDGDWSTQYYSPPQRDWSYDAMRNAPLIPQITYISVKNWRETSSVSVKTFEND